MAIQRAESTKTVRGNPDESATIASSISTTTEIKSTSHEASNTTFLLKMETARSESAARSFYQNPTLWLIIWTCNNIGITLLNKASFATVDFKYPYFLSALHMLLNAAGSHLIFWSLERKRVAESDGDSQLKELPCSANDCWVTLLFGNLQRQSLDSKGRRLMLAFSVVFSANIAIGNVSLQYVSVNFNQVMRSLVPAITIAMGFVLGKPTSLARQLAVLPVVVGVAMACFGDMTFTPVGFWYTFLCIVLAALKVVSSGEMLTGTFRLHPFDLLGYLSPLAFFQCLAISFASGEVVEVMHRLKTDMNPMVNPYPLVVVFMSGILSFGFNISSLQTNKLTSPLTLCIAGNVKQVLMIIIATMVFSTPITPLNAAGIVVVLAGSAWYSYISLTEKSLPKKKHVSTDIENGEVDASELVKLIPKASSSLSRGVQRSNSYRGVLRAASAPASGTGSKSFHNSHSSSTCV